MFPDPTRRMLPLAVLLPVGLVHHKGDGRKREAALEGISAQLRSWRQDIVVISSQDALSCVL